MTLLFALALTQQTVRYDLTLSRTFTYEVVQTFRTVEGEEETTTRESWTYTPVEALAGGAARLETVKATTGLVVDGREIAVRAVPHKGSEKRSPRGASHDREPASQIEPSFELRLLRIGDIEFPSGTVTVGQSWVRESQPTDDGMPAARWEWTPKESRQGRLSGTFTFVEKGTERPIQAEGSFVVSLSDGWPVSLSFKAVNTHQLGDEEKLPCVYSFSMKRV